MEKTVLIEQTAKKIKLTELIVLMCLFGSIATGLGRCIFGFRSESLCSALSELPFSRSAVFASGGGG